MEGWGYRAEQKRGRKEIKVWYKIILMDLKIDNINQNTNSNENIDMRENIIMMTNISKIVVEINCIN